MISAIFFKIMRFIVFFLFGVLVIGCETTSPITSPKVIPEPEKKVIYEPKEEALVIVENEESKVKNFKNIKSFEGKKLTALMDKYGNFNFSKLEQTFEFHRYNAENCRIFIQNYTSNKIIVHITIYNLGTKKTHNQYQEESCT